MEGYNGKHEGGYAFVDWDTIKTLDDMKQLLQAVGIAFVRGAPNYEMAKRFLHTNTDTGSDSKHKTPKSNNNSNNYGGGSGYYTPPGY